MNGYLCLTFAFVLGVPALAANAASLATPATYERDAGDRGGFGDLRGSWSGRYGRKRGFRSELFADLADYRFDIRSGKCVLAAQEPREQQSIA